MASHPHEISLVSIRTAAEAVAAVLPPTLSWRYPLLDTAAGCEVVVKHENHQPTGAFKVRGGLALLASLRADEIGRGVVAASTGNHAQSIAFAAARHGVPATVVMPVGAPEGKAAATRALGAEVIRFGDDMTEAGEHARMVAERDGWRYVGPADEPAIVCGHATASLELLTDHRDLEALYIPIGSGTGAAGACVVRDALAPRCRIIGVQSALAPAGYESWRAGRIVTMPCTTRVSGVATAQGYELPQSILRERLDDFLLVDDDAIDAARRLLARTAHTMAEGAGAAALAGLLAHTDRPRRVAIMVSGGNADEAELASM